MLRDQRVSAFGNYDGLEAGELMPEIPALFSYSQMTGCKHQKEFPADSLRCQFFFFWGAVCVEALWCTCCPVLLIVETGRIF